MAKYTCVACVIVVLLVGLLFANGQALERAIGVRVQGNYFSPIGALADRFDATAGGGGGMTLELTPRLDLEMRIFFGKFEGSLDEVADFSIRDEVVMVDLYPDVKSKFEVVGVTFSGVYRVLETAGVKPYIVCGGGLYRWLHERSETFYYYGEENEKRIWELVRQAYSVGLNVGGGINFALSPSVMFSVDARYEMILDALWPLYTLGYNQVNPIHFLTLEAGIRVLL